MKSERVSYKRRRAANNYTMNERERESRKERWPEPSKEEGGAARGNFLKKNVHPIRRLCVKPSVVPWPSR